MRWGAEHYVWARMIPVTPYSTATPSSEGAEVRIHAAFTLQRRELGQVCRSLSFVSPEILSITPWAKTHRGHGPWAPPEESPRCSPRLCLWAGEEPGGVSRQGPGAVPTQHWSVVLGEDLILGAVRKHIDEIAEVPQPVSQGPDGEIPCGEWFQVPQVAFRCEKNNLIPISHQQQEEDQGCGALRQACKRNMGFYIRACAATPACREESRCRMFYSANQMSRY